MNCEYPDCDKLSIPPTRSCLDHFCAADEFQCYNPRDPSNIHDGCKFHRKCKYESCYNFLYSNVVENDHIYCHDHECRETKCRKFELNKFCPEHKCEVEGCIRKKYYNKFCFNHTCYFLGCGNYSKKNYCKECIESRDVCEPCGRKLNQGEPECYICLRKNYLPSK